jgi:hypothetical protein
MNQNSTTTQTVHDGVQHSKPIPISTQHLRHRSTSFSSDSSNSSTSSPPLLTPNNLSNTRIAASSSSPIFHFLSPSSPTKTSATFPFRGFVPPPLLEGVERRVISSFYFLDTLADEPVDERTPPTQHVRRASTAGRFHPQLSVPELHHERGVNVLKRLSLGGQLGKVCLFIVFAPFNSPDVP